ncbi:sulfite exporter TauE/SafE family protein [Cribrihabitans neustonicus]|uniref:sulfite exporter TauE/SafE family protein n=1 Tax=Cribrihabitans neustonicus TaxID=1429085 RepID=UPI003B5B1423
MQLTEIALLVAAGAGAGVLNAVAGGGTFLTFPALIWLGIPPVAANATATLSALPGYAGSAWGFRHDLKAEGALSLLATALIAALGGLAGAGLLIVTPGEVFIGVVPWLLLAATLLFAAGPGLLRWARRFGSAAAGPVTSAAAIFAVSVYGGYFNGGLGIVLLAAFGLLGYVSLHGMNGLKTLLSAVLSLIPAATFAMAGMIAWEQAMVLALATAAGGFGGAWISRRIQRTHLLRGFVTLTGAGLTLAFFLN